MGLLRASPFGHGYFMEINQRNYDSAVMQFAKWEAIQWRTKAKKKTIKAEVKANEIERYAGVGIRF